MDLTRSRMEGARASWVGLWSEWFWFWFWYCGFLLWDLKLEERKMVPIVRLRRQKRTVGVNQLEIEAHVVKIAALIAGAWREREREEFWREIS